VGPELEDEDAVGVLDLVELRQPLFQLRLRARHAPSISRRAHTTEKRGEDDIPDLGDVGAAWVDDLEHELLAGQEAVGHELARAEGDRRSGLRIRHGCCGCAGAAAAAGAGGREGEEGWRRWMRSFCVSGYM